VRVCIIPPESVWGPIQDVRAVHDKVQYKAGTVLSCTFLLFHLHCTTCQLSRTRYRTRQVRCCLELTVPTAL